MTDMHEYAFDVKLAAVVRVKAEDETAALRALTWALECADIGFSDDEWRALHKGVTLTEASLEINDADGPKLFEVDGKDVEDKQPMFFNYYRCPRCNNKWEDKWSAMADDDCANCGFRHVSPYESEEIG